MPLVSRSGSLVESSPSPGDQTPTTTADLLDNASFIRTPALERTAFNPNTYSQTQGELQGYLDGNRIAVRYFLRAQPSAYDRSQVMDATSGRHSLHSQYIEIINLELTFLGDGVTSSYDSKSGETTVKGEAVVYAGLNPNKGDYFTLDIGDGSTGLMKVTDVQALTFRTGRNHKIAFKLDQVATEEALQLLIDQSIETFYFDKKTYLGDNGTLLESTAYRNLQRLRQTRVLIAQRFHQLFYDPDMDSWLPPNGVYDPHVVSFMGRKIPFDYIKKRPAQLLPEAGREFERSLWARLLNNRDLSIQGLWRWTTTETNTERSFNAFITTLVNRPYLKLLAPPVDAALGAGESASYVLSPAFYAGQPAAMTALDRLVHEVITTRKVANVSALVENFINPYQSLSDEQAFYSWPLYLQAIDTAVQTIARPVDSYL